MLTPNNTYNVFGVSVKEKIIPDGTVWKTGSRKGTKYKKERKLSGNTGVVQSVTIHNTNDRPTADYDAEWYTQATYDEGMGRARVHFYVDDKDAWQNLKAGTGMTPDDPENSAEVSWHTKGSDGNPTSLSIEIIMSGNGTEEDAVAMDNGARLAAYLLSKHGLSVDDLLTHTYWVNKFVGNSFDDLDTQCTNEVYDEKWCPAYIMGKKSEAKTNWIAFKNLVKRYMQIYNRVICADVVNIRSGPSTCYDIVGTICKCCKAHLLEIKTDPLGISWGLLRDYNGWILLNNTISA